MTFRYIGSKARMAAPLARAIEELDNGEGRFVDAFSGTGAVSELAASLGWPVWANDALESAIVMTSARLATMRDVQMRAIGGYLSALEALNNLQPVQGAMWQRYSPASSLFDENGIERRYFTEQNAAKIDAIRLQIARWTDEGHLTDREEQLLVADLISAANRVANIAGTYGCFLSKWQKSAFHSLVMRPRDLKLQPTELTTSVADVVTLRPQSADLVYLDPPYTKRQYASYYHILETIAAGDAPDVSGVSGLRPWKEKASAFCYKTKALGALVSLVEGMSATRVLISYSGEGHVDLNDLTSALENTGSIDCIPVEGIGRYRPNVTASANGDNVTEYLLSYRRSVVLKRVDELPAKDHIGLQGLAN